MPDDSVFQTPNLYGPAQMYGMTGRFDYKGLEPQHALAERRLDQRQMIANALMNQSAVPRRGKMAGRLYQPASWTEGAGQLGEALAGVLLAKNIDREREQAQADATARIAAAFQAYNKGTSPTPAFTAETVPGTAVEAVEAQPAVGVPSNLESIIAQGQLPSEPGTVRKSVEDVTNAMAQREQMSPWLRPAAGLPPTRRFAPPPSAPDASLSLDHLFEAAQPGRQPYVPAVETQPAVAGVEGKPDRRATVGEILTRTFSPEFAAHFRQYGYKDMDDKTAAEVAQIVENVKRPNTPEIPRTPSELMAADTALLASGAPGAWPLIQLNMQQRQQQAEAASKPPQQLDLGDKVITYDKNGVRGVFKKGATPSAPVITNVGDRHVVTRDGMEIGSIPNNLSPADKIKAMNDLILLGSGGTPEVNKQLLQAKMDIAAAGRPTTTVSMTDTASVAAAKEHMKHLAVTREKLRDLPGVLESMEASKALIAKAGPFVGSLGEMKLDVVKFFNNNFNLDLKVNEVMGAEELRSRLFVPVMTFLRTLDAQPTKEQQRILQDALGNPNTDPRALSHVIDVFEGLIAGKVQRYNDDVASAEKRGTQFPYDAPIPLPKFIQDRQRALEYLKSGKP